jgi:hypothetical protein
MESFKATLQGPVWFLQFNPEEKPENGETVYGFTNSKRLRDEIERDRRHFEAIVKDKEDKYRPEFDTYETNQPGCIIQENAASYARREGFRTSSVNTSPRLWVTTDSKPSSIKPYQTRN